MPDPTNAPAGATPKDQPKDAPKDQPAATRPGTGPRPGPDAKFRVIVPCAVSCRPGDLVTRAQLRPRAAGLSDEATESATDAVIERLTGLGAIVLLTKEEIDAEEERLTRPV